MDNKLVGLDWLIQRINNMIDSVEHATPIEFNEKNRYLPAGVGPRSGYIRYDLFPFFREIIDCFDPRSEVREVNLKKGVQVGYTTALESILLYYIGHIKTAPVLFITADSELAKHRVDNNVIPMLIDSEMMHLIRSSDTTSTRKTGKTEGNIQWDGGGFLIYNGAQNAAKMRQFSMPLLLKDEVDGWPKNVGRDGDPDKLTDDRASAYWAVRKILRGSTPLEMPSMIEKNYQRGDQREYNICCKKCNAPQVLRMKHLGTKGGFTWEMEKNRLVIDSVRYLCKECGHPHVEVDKELLFSPDEGAHWAPTAVPVEPGIRSYHLPAFYSPYGFRPWSKNILDYIEAYDEKSKSVLDPGKFQVFYNNVLGEAFEVLGGRVHFTSVSSHRRSIYRLGNIPNKYAAKYSGSPILFLTCLVDVHDNNLAVSIFGWCRNAICYLIDYERYERGKGEPPCTDTASPVWLRMSSLLEEKTYVADDGMQYVIPITLVDAGYANDTVVTWTSGYSSGVYPVLGRDRAAKHQTIKEFAEFETQAGTVGYRILVDHYKDRLAPALRRMWTEDAGPQIRYHFNAPIDLPDKALKELTVEVRRERVDERGVTTYYWYRPGNARNELWDLLVYGHAAVEIYAWAICIQHFELEKIDWDKFWDFVQLPSNDSLFGRFKKS